jgi:hypothetical protein
MRYRNDITADYVRSILDYNPATGDFFWKERDNVRKGWNTVYAGKKAGTLNVEGYRLISINDVYYQAHRLAWLHYYGEWPSSTIDHGNHSHDDNRIANLEDATYSEQQHHKTLMKNSKTGVTGVYFSKSLNRFVAHLAVGGKDVFRRKFKTLDEAIAARKAAEEQFHPFGVARKRGALAPLD